MTEKFYECFAHSIRTLAPDFTLNEEEIQVLFKSKSLDEFINKVKEINDGKYASVITKIVEVAELLSSLIKDGGYDAAR